MERFNFKVPGNMPHAVGGVLRVAGERSGRDGRGVSDGKENGAKELVERDHGYSAKNRKV